MGKIALVRVRGRVKIAKEIRDTLNMLRLYNKNYATVIDDNPKIMGMVKKVKYFITYGVIDDALFKDLLEKRGEDYKGRTSDSKGKIDYKNKYYG